MGFVLGDMNNSLMSYATFKSAPKAVIQSSDIGPGQIKTEHLDPALFAEIKSIGLHNHSGVKSRRIDYQNLQGAIPASGFYMYSSDSTKRYHVTIDSATNAFVLTEA